MDKADSRSTEGRRGVQLESTSIERARESLLAKLKRYKLHLSAEEFLFIQQRLSGRLPTLAECVLWAIQGSEHCSYKSSKVHLKKMSSAAPHVLLGPAEDAGIIAIAQDRQGLRYGVVVSHESHNHPSQLVPYEGAATGVGGNVRDVVCMGAEVIAMANGLRFGAIARAQTKATQDGVVAGIAGYTNAIGVPTIAGDLYYDARYNDNCLVTVVTLGLVREDEIIHSFVPKDTTEALFILVGKASDGSGFAGASFASQNLTDNKQNRSAIQEPNAFLKQHLLQANYALFKKFKAMNCLHQVGFKDLGAGGIACASIEMAAASGFGAAINLDWVPTAEPQLAPEVVLCAETQERFLWVVPPALKELVLEHYNQSYALADICEGAQAAVIGTVTHDGFYTVTTNGEQIVHARPHELSAGIIYERPYYASPQELTEPYLEPPSDYNQLLLDLLAHENISSRAPVFERYDKQVQGRTIIEAGESDAGLMQPFNDPSYPEEIRSTGLALSLDQSPRYNLISPYWGAVNAVVESARNIVATGATPLAITDCLCFGNPEHPEQMWDFAESVRGLVAACAAIGLNEQPEISLPIISGNVSFYNESTTTVIPPSPMISCIGTMPDVAKAITLGFKHSDSLIILIGERLNECGGSIYYELQGQLGAHCPQPDLAQIGNELRAVQQAIAQELVLAAHDVSEGGLAVALAEMTFPQEIGLCVTIPGALPLAQKLFSETGGFILEVKKESFAAVQDCFSRYTIPIFVLGTTLSQPIIAMNSCINLPVAQAKHCWQHGLRNKLLGSTS